MKNYTYSLAVHVGSITLFAIAGAFAVTQHLWFCATACIVLLTGICISLYRTQNRQIRMMQRIVECMKNNDLSQLMCAPFNNPTMQQLATDMSTALKNIRTHLNEEESSSAIRTEELNG